MGDASSRWLIHMPTMLAGTAAVSPPKWTMMVICPTTPFARTCNQEPCLTNQISRTGIDPVSNYAVYRTKVAYSMAQGT